MINISNRLSCPLQYVWVYEASLYDTNAHQAMEMLVKRHSVVWQQRDRQFDNWITAKTTFGSQQLNTYHICTILIVDSPQCVFGYTYTAVTPIIIIEMFKFSWICLLSRVYVISLNLYFPITAIHLIHRHPIDGLRMWHYCIAIDFGFDHFEIYFRCIVWINWRRIEWIGSRYFIFGEL